MKRVTLHEAERQIVAGTIDRLTQCMGNPDGWTPGDQALLESALEILGVRPRGFGGKATPEEMIGSGKPPAAPEEFKTGWAPENDADDEDEMDDPSH
jgi:hypothetical protein